MRSIHGIAQNQALKVECLEYAERKFQEIINDDSKSEETKTKELARLIEYMEDHFSVKKMVENTHTDSEMENIDVSASHARDFSRELDALFLSFLKT